MEAEIVEIAKRRIGAVKQCHGHSLPDPNITPESQALARLGCVIKECSNLLWVSKGEKVIFSLRILSIQTESIEDHSIIFI